MGANVLVYVVLTPLMLRQLGQYRFGIFAILLAVANYSSLGIGWMTGTGVKYLGSPGTSPGTTSSGPTRGLTTRPRMRSISDSLSNSKRPELLNLSAQSLTRPSGCPNDGVHLKEHSRAY